MNDKNFNSDINRILLSIIDLENELSSISGSDLFKKEQLTEKIYFARKQLSHIEKELELLNISSNDSLIKEPTIDELTVITSKYIEKPSLSDADKNETVHLEPSFIPKDEVLILPTTDEIQDTSTIEDDTCSPPKEEVIKVIKEPSVLSLFLKENLKLLIFSSFLFIGLVWLFVYVTNLTSYSEEIRIATGFVISIALFLINYIKKFDGNKATSFILSSYITGLLSLLFGSVVLDVIPQTVAIVISLIYISFGLSYVNKLNSSLYETLIILSSLLLTFAYRYVDAPFEILFIYINLLIISLTFILKKRQNHITSSLLIMFSLFVTSIITLMSHNKILSNISFSVVDFNSEVSLYKLISSFDINYELLVLLPISTIFLSLFSWNYLQNTFDNNASIKRFTLGSIYLALFSYIFKMKNLVLVFLSDNKTFLLATLLIIVISSLFILFTIKQKNKSLNEFNTISLFIGLIFGLSAIIPDQSIHLIDTVSIINLFVLIYVAFKNEFISLRFVGYIYSISTFVTFTKHLLPTFLNNTSSLEPLLIINPLLLTATLLFAIKLNLKEVIFSNDSLTEIFDFVSKTFTLVWTIIPFISMNLLFSYMDFLIGTDKLFSILGNIIISFLVIHFSAKIKSVFFCSIGLLHYFILLIYILSTKDIYIDFLSFDTLNLFLFALLSLKYIFLLNSEKTFKNDDSYLLNKFNDKILTPIVIITSMFIFSSIIESFVNWIEFGEGFVILGISILLFIFANLTFKFNHTISKILLVFYTIYYSFQFSNFLTYHYGEDYNIVFNSTTLFSLLFISYLFYLLKLSVNYFNINSKRNFAYVLNMFSILISNAFILVILSTISLNIEELFNVNFALSSMIITFILFLQLLLSNTFKNYIIYFVSYSFAVYNFFLQLDNVTTLPEKIPMLNWFNVLLFAILILWDINKIKQSISINNSRLLQFAYPSYKSIAIIGLLSFLLPLSSYLSYHFNSTFVMFNLFNLGILSVVIYQLGSKNINTEKDFDKIPRIFAQFILLVSSIITLFVGDFSFDSELSLAFIIVELVTVLLFIYLSLFISNNYKDIPLDLLGKIKLSETNIFFIKIPFNLFNTFIFINLINQWFINSDIISNNFIVGFSIVYMLYEISLIEKIKEINKIVYSFTYSLIGIYLFILVFILLADTAFIIRAIVFIMIGVYGLFTALKNNKNEIE